MIARWCDTIILYGSKEVLGYAGVLNVDCENNQGSPGKERAGVKSRPLWIEVQQQVSPVLEVSIFLGGVHNQTPASTMVV